MTEEERREMIEDIENILMLYGVAPGSDDFSVWSDEELIDFDPQEYLKSR